MKIIPNKNQIYIEPVKEEQILKKPSDDSITEKGKILAIGESIQDFKAGDVVLFNAFLANKVEIKGDSYYFVVESDIFATVNDTN